MVRVACVCLTLLFGLGAQLAAAADLALRPREPVDVALVLAVDVSGSINEERYALQRDGFAQAFRSKAVLDAIGSGEHRSIAVTLVEWSGAQHQRQVIGWTRIDDADSATIFASAIAETPRVFSDWTSISAAIDFSVRLFDTCEYLPSRMVIDVSGDGANNNGRPVKLARDEAVARGIIINGLPILAEDKNLETYYGDQVIGGPGSFTIAAEDFDSFARSVLGKLVREIAGRELPEIILAAVTP